MATKKDNQLLLLAALGVGVFFLATRKPEKVFTDAEKAEIKKKHRSM